jgi:hypothetical protein
MSRDVRSLVEKLRALEAPEEDQQKLAQLTGLMEQQTNEADGMVVAVSQQDLASFQSHQQQVASLEPQVNGAALALGANSCAQFLATAAFSDLAGQSRLFLPRVGTQPLGCVRRWRNA